MTGLRGGDDDLFINLNTAGLAALLKGVEAAMVEGHGHLTLGACGMTASRAGSARPFAKVTVKYVHHVGPSEGEPSEPDPLPGLPVLELQD